MKEAILAVITLTLLIVIVIQYNQKSTEPSLEGSDSKAQNEARSQTIRDLPMHIK